jgi:hypothetical protein
LLGDGLTLPPGVSQTITDIGNSIGDIIGSLVGSIQSIGNAVNESPVISTVLNSARTSTGTTVSKITTAVGLAATATAALASLLFASPLALSELLLLPFRLWTLMLIFFGHKKPRRPWGTVYDSVTKQPIDPAYVVLMDMQGNEVSTSITDINGRYGFLVPPGTYTIVANKTNYQFPSKKLLGKTGDELYGDLYFGGTIVITKEDEVVAKNIPMDQLNFDWNEFAKNAQKRLAYYKRSDLIIARVSNFFFWLGATLSIISLLAAQSTYNIVVFLIYVFVFIVRHYSVALKAKGSVVDAVTGQPLPFAIVHVLSRATGQEVIHKVADRLGNYYCLVPNGSYQVVIDRKNADESYTKIPVTEPVEVNKGYLKKEFTV